MGLTVTSDDKGVMIFSKEIEGQNGKFTVYSLGVSSKNQDGGYDNSYFPCRFKKGVTIENKTKIKINNAFFITTKSGEKKSPALMITDFTDMSGNIGGEGGFIDVDKMTDSELPFA